MPFVVSVRAEGDQELLLVTMLRLLGQRQSKLRVLSGMKNVVCYFDDILITTRSIEEHKEILSEIFQRLESHNIKAKLSKCEFFKSSVIQAWIQDRQRRIASN